MPCMEACLQHFQGKSNGGLPTGSYCQLLVHWQSPTCKLSTSTPPTARADLVFRFDEMKDIVGQMVLKFARNGSEAAIPVTDDFTRLTLDSIGLCAMDTRFNSFSHDKLHPFVDAMVGMLLESNARSRRPKAQLSLMEMFNSSAQYHFNQDIKLMQQVAMDCVERRRKHPSDKKDLLNQMLLGVDSKTGQKMTDQSICDNMITFLIVRYTAHFVFLN